MAVVEKWVPGWVHDPGSAAFSVAGLLGGVPGRRQALGRPTSRGPIYGRSGCHIARLSHAKRPLTAFWQVNGRFGVLPG